MAGLVTCCSPWRESLPLFCLSARYGTLREWAKQLGNTQAHDLLSQILDMEKAANAKLTTLAVTSLNMAA